MTSKALTPVSEVPVEGFDYGSEFARSYFKDETVTEREQFEEINGFEPEHCSKEHWSGNRGSCTRPEGHIQRGENGMHLAGNGTCLVGAW